MCGQALQNVTDLNLLKDVTYQPESGMKNLAGEDDLAFSSGIVFSVLMVFLKPFCKKNEFQTVNFIS